MINYLPRKLTILMLALVLGLAPLLSYADNDRDKNNKGRGDDNRSGITHSNDDDEDDDNNRKGSRTNNGSCFRAFGHLIAPGFIKNKGEVNFLGDCFLPFGINKKFRGLASSTPDTVAPTISKLSIDPNTSKARVSWETNERSDSAIFWSTSADFDVNSTSTASSTKSEMTKDHKMVIENLSASTTYYVIVRSRDAALNTSFSSETSFTTKSLSPDNTPPVVSEMALLVGTSTIDVTWKTNEDATSRVYYSTSASLDVNATTTNFLENSTPKKNHLLTLTSLTPQTAYYMVIESKDPGDNKTLTPTFTANTNSL